MEVEIIHQKIYEIRGQRVKLDFDLAILYEVETRRLKEAVRRNLNRFPADFMFELTLEKGKYSKFSPFAFTEHGITLLSCYDTIKRQQKRLSLF